MPAPQEQTPKLSEHARLRCAQMGVVTKRVKHLVRQADIVYPGNPGTDCLIAVSDCDPEIAVVYAHRDGQLVVVTVLYRGIKFERPDADLARSS